MQKDTPATPSFLQRSWLRAVYLIRSLESRLNRPLLPRERDRSLQGQWEGGIDLDRLVEGRPRLLISITTYQRTAELRRLVEELAADPALGAADTWICVFNDRSDADYTEAKGALSRSFPGRHLWLDARERMGKQGFWRTHQTIFLAARLANAEFLLSLQDDIQLAPRFMERLWKVWAATGLDPARRVLYLYSSDDDVAEGRWTGFERVEIPGHPARRTDWFDLQGFLIDRKGLALLRYWVVPVTAWRWRRNTVHSSGVGRQFTRRLFGRASTWQCDPPLIFHGAAGSEMNAEARRRNPLDNRALFPGSAPTA